MTTSIAERRTCAVTEARSLLFVPGNRPDRFAKALDSGADTVVLDLEDAVALDQKAQARDAILSAWHAFDAAQHARLLVRINPQASPWHVDDLALVAALPGLGAIMLPKAESRQQLDALAQACPGTAVLPLVESAEGAARLDELARAPNVLRLGLGHLDLQADLGMSCGEDEAELAPLRWALVVASRRAALAPPVDGVTTATNDGAILARDALRSRRFGFTGKLCIHPAQVAGVHAALSPTAAEVDWARRVMAALESAGTGACSVDGKMVDAPIVLLAQQILRRQTPQ